ncbi:hypothetical protein M075_4137 [Bacteroides fragilis str. 20793-3]|nr:hypothetical protein M075_4137 [Bacteroides fragilis str. 20793-3]
MEISFVAFSERQPAKNVQLFNIYCKNNCFIMRNSKNIFKFAADIISRYLRSNGYFFQLVIKLLASYFFICPPFLLR